MKESLPHDLDRLADVVAYNDWIVHRARPWLRGSVLDAGAGIGTHTDRLAESAEMVVALEPDPALAALLRRRVNATVVVGDATAVSGPFDVIACFNVLEHINDDQTMLHRFSELLAPGGHLLLLVPAHPWLLCSLDRAFGHFRRYTAGDLRRKLQEAELIPCQIKYVNPIGAVGWFFHGKVLRREHLPVGALTIYSRLVPTLRYLDRLHLPLGLSVWAVAGRPLVDQAE
jgi:SAM-dependent methyltransferase